MIIRNVDKIKKVGEDMYKNNLNNLVSSENNTSLLWCSL